MSAYLYGLTDLTGRKRNDGRTVIVNGFEFGRRQLIVTTISVGASLLPTIALTAAFGPLATIIVPVLFVGTAFFLFESRTRKGLEVRRYRSILDQRKANPKEIYICGQPVSETLGFATIVASAAPVARPVTATDSPVFVAPARGRSHSTVTDILKDKTA